MELATVSFANYPKNRVAFITLIGGKLISNQDTFAQLMQHIKTCWTQRFKEWLDLLLPVCGSGMGLKNALL